MVTRYGSTMVDWRVHAPAEQSVGERRVARYVFAGLRIVVGWVFLWAFLDKLVRP